MSVKSKKPIRIFLNDYTILLPIFASFVITSFVSLPIAEANILSVAGIFLGIIIFLGTWMLNRREKRIDLVYDRYMEAVRYSTHATMLVDGMGMLIDCGATKLKSNSELKELRHRIMSGSIPDPCHSYSQKLSQGNLLRFLKYSQQKGHSLKGAASVLTAMIAFEAEINSRASRS